MRRLLLSLLVLALTVSSFAGEDPFSGREIRVLDATAKPGTQATAPAPATTGNTKAVVGTVDVTTTLNIRTAPWGDIIGTLGPNDKVKIVGQIGDWYRIEHQGRFAYVHSAYILRPGEGPKPFPRSGTINAPTGANLRRVPFGDVLGSLADGTAVEILGVSGDYYKVKHGQNEAFVLRRYIDARTPATPTGGSNQVTPLAFIGYVSANTALNVREGPWGKIVTTLPHGIAVQVTGKQGDWYRINYNGRSLYVHASYVSKSKPSGGGSNPSVTNPGNPPTQPSASGDLQKRVVAEARKLVGSTRFRTADVDYGNLACAKVVSTALVNAGAMSNVVLNVRAVVSALHAKGWKDVRVPPYHEGDVITWKTYDYTGDGVKDPDTHVGIIVKQGNTMMVMNNSSRLRTPRICEINIAPITRVMRKV